METLRNKRKIAAFSGDSQESARNGEPQNTFVPGMTEECNTQVSEEIEGRVTIKLSQEFSRTESRILGALSKLDGFLLNPQIWTCSVTVPRTSRNNDSESREPSGDRSLNDPYPEVEFSIRQANTSNDSDKEETYHNMRGLRPSRLKWNSVLITTNAVLKHKGSFHLKRFFRDFGATHRNMKTL